MKMLRFKDGQPIYNYLVKNDLDDIDDDQPIDFSKRYSDQESCDINGKKRHTSIPVHSDSNAFKNSCNDEVKVYCHEGTPFVISSASSLCDLRNIGQNTISKQKTPDFLSEGDLTKISSEVSGYQITPSRDFEEHSTETVENFFKIGPTEIIRNFSMEGDSREKVRQVSQVSSPLMFSRSSSLESLSSFEQHSVQDDRSSVSAFSTLASGIISPSEIPDSPGEVISPLYHKSKNIEFHYPFNGSERESKNNQPTSKINLQLPEESIFETSEDDMKVFNDEGDFSSMSSLSSLSLRTSSNYERNSVKQDSAIAQMVKSSLKISISRKQSIHTEMNVNNDKKEIKKVQEKLDNFRFSPDVPDCIPIDLSVKFTNDSSQSSAYKALEFLKTKPYDSIIENNHHPINAHFKNSAEYQQNLKIIEKCSKFIYQPEDEVIKFTNNSKDDSSSDESDDDEDVKECIRNGKPKLMEETFSNTLAAPFTSSPVFQENMQDYISQSSDDDLSDEDNILINRCIQMGMPQKKLEADNKLLHKGNSSFQLMESCSTNKHLTKMENVFQGSIEKIKDNGCNNDFFDKSLDVCNKNVVSDSDDEEDEDETLKRCIQLGMPTRKENINLNTTVGRSEILNKSNNTNSPQVRSSLQQHMPVDMPNAFRSNSDILLSYPPFPSYNQNLGCRDNCPDGISDDDDDDDILAQCIEAGKPSANSSLNISVQSYLSPDRNHNPRIQALRKAPASDKSVGKKRIVSSDLHTKTRCISPSNIAEGDSLCVYQTEDTPILSPTASISDLSMLSFNEDKSCLNNSRNSDCSSDSEDELLLQCIRSGMPEAKH